MRVHLKTVLKLDKVGFSLSILMTSYLGVFHLLLLQEGTILNANDPSSSFLYIPSLIYALIMSFLCGLNVLKISKIRKKYIKPRHRTHRALSKDQEQ